MMKYLLYAVLSYILFIVLLYLIQRTLIYHPSHGSPAPSDWEVPDMEVVKLTTDDSLTLTAWYKSARAGKPTLIYFHGNAFHLGGRGFIVRSYLDAGLGVLLVSYRGYADNPGHPSEEGLYRDARAAIKFIKEKNIAPECSVLYGESLGTGVAVQMATEYPVGSLILWSPYTSLGAVGQAHYFYLPVRWLLRDRFDSLSKIKNVHTPLFIMHSEEDQLIPVALAHTLYKTANSPKDALFFKGLGHNDYVNVSAQVIAFIQQHTQCK